MVRITPEAGSDLLGAFFPFLRLSSSHPVSVSLKAHTEVLVGVVFPKLLIPDLLVFW